MCSRSFRCVVLLTAAALAGCSSAPPPAAVGGTALCADPHSEPDVVEDLRQIRRFEQEAHKLVEADTLTNMSDLRKQLGRKQCKLKLLPRPKAAMTPAEIYRKCRGGTLMVGTVYKCKRCPRWHASLASGFVISASGAAVTNYHVLDKDDQRGMIAMTYGGKVFAVKEVLAASKSNDVAIVQLDVGEARLEPLALSPDVPVGTPVCVISHPSRALWSLTCGHVSRYVMGRKGRANMPLMIITADFARGSSGGPVLDDRGAVAGLVASTRSIYYSVTKEKKENLQMVIKNCIPAASVIKLIASP